MENSNDLVPSNSHYLSLVQRLSYSVGHVFNDLCAAFWFTYLLIYMHFVNGFNSDTAGTLMLIGQVADGLATPFIGIECDRNLDWWLCRYGRRKSWHLIGTICVFFSFPFLFNRCISCEDSPEKSQLVYYAAFICIFQFGWAAVQISHLSLIPDLTPLSCERVELNALRYAFTVFANITVYILMWLVLNWNDKSDDASQTVGPQDAVTFREVAFFVIGLGCLFSFIFHFGVREKGRPQLENNGDESAPSSSSQSDLVEPVKRAMVWQNWFRESQFYKVALLYMGTRLTINLTQVYVPAYLQETLYLPKKSVAYIPLVIYTSGFLSSFLMKYINVKLGKKLTFFLGACLSIVACTWIFFGNGDFFKTYGIFAVSVIIGASSSTMLITSLAITSDLIGQNTASGAFVFGAMSFVDKVSNGVAVMVIESLKPCKTCSCLFCDFYYRNILTFICGGATAISLVALVLLSNKKIGQLKRANVGYSQVDTVERPVPDDHEQSFLISSPLLDNIDDSS